MTGLSTFSTMTTPTIPRRAAGCGSPPSPRASPTGRRSGLQERLGAAPPGLTANSRRARDLRPRRPARLRTVAYSENGTPRATPGCFARGAVRYTLGLSAFSEDGGEELAAHSVHIYATARWGCSGNLSALRAARDVNRNGDADLIGHRRIDVDTWSRY